MTRTRIAAAVAALTVAGSVVLTVPAAFAHGSDGKPADPSTSSVDPLPGTEDPEWFDIGTPPTLDGVIEDGGEAPTAP